MKKIIYLEDDDYEDYIGIFDKCEHCGVLVNFDLLDDENVIYSKEGCEEYLGFKINMPDSVAGFICPECGGRSLY